MTDLTGLIHNMPEDEYRAVPALSGTGVADLLRSPALYRHKLDHPDPPTPAMVLGTLVHALVLGTEPTAAVAPYPDFRTKEAREWRDAQTLDVVTTETWERAEAIAAAVRSHPAARLLLDSPGTAEVTLQWQEGETPCKGRVDWLVDGTLVVDLKTTRDIEAFGKSIGAYGYHAQVMHYRRGVTSGEPSDLPRPVLVVVENEPPHRVGVWRLSERDAAQGEAMCEEAYRRYADCAEAGAWPTGLPDEIVETDIPPWALRTWDDRIGGDDYLAAETLAALETIITGGRK